MIGLAADRSSVSACRLACVSGLLFACSLGVVPASLAARTTPKARFPGGAEPPVVTLLRREGFAEYEAFVASFRGRLRADTRVLAVRPDNGPSLIDYLRAARPALVVAVGEAAYRLALRAGVGPLLTVYVVDGALPEDQAVAAPVAPEQVLATLAALRPEAHTLGVLSGPTPAPAAFERSLARELRRRALRLVRLTGPSGAEAMRQLRREAGHLDAIWLLPSPESLTSRLVRYAIALQLHRRIPLIGVTRQHVRAGALFALDFTPEQLALAASEQANAVLTRGAAADGPRARPASAGTAHRPAGPGTPRLTINALTAARLSVDLASWVARAEIIAP